MGANAAPMGPADRGEGRRSSHGARAVEVGKERRAGTPSPCGTPVSFSCGKLKARIKGFPFGNPRRVLLGLGETPSRFRTPSFIYVGRGCLKAHKFHAAQSHAHHPAPAPRRRRRAAVASPSPPALVPVISSASSS